MDKSSVAESAASVASDLTAGETLSQSEWQEAIRFRDALIADLRAALPEDVEERIVALAHRRRRKPLNLSISREWFERKVGLEDGCEIGAGLRTETPELAEALGWMVRAQEAEAALRQANLGLTLAANTFREYARLHRAKGTADGEVKATRNDEMAAVCERAKSREARS